MRETIMEVDIKKFKNNIESIKNFVGSRKIMPVIKANGYGSYINKCLDIVNQFDIVATALVSEAVELRKMGYKNEIFVLNQPSFDELDDIVKYDITVGLSSLEFLKKVNKKIKIHLEIETGMNRTGIKFNDLEDMISNIKLNKNIIVEGVYTHFSSADYDYDYTNKQIRLFRKCVNILKNNFANIKYIHSSASNGFLNFDDDISNMVRPGVIMYGYYSCNEVRDKIKIEPICKLKTKITYIKNISKGESISYGRRYITKRNSVIATIPIGYADGLRRALSNNGSVVINGKKAPIVGSVCMDSCMVDVSDIENVFVGTEVYIWDNEVITLEEIAARCDTINYEILCTVSDRVPRIFIV